MHHWLSPRSPSPTWCLPLPGPNQAIAGAEPVVASSRSQQQQPPMQQRSTASSAASISTAAATATEADQDPQQELLTEKAVTVIRRVMDKLTGLDFYDPASLAPPQVRATSCWLRLDMQSLPHHVGLSLVVCTLQALDVPEQVDRLIIQAMANENLCLSFLGWCPFW